MLDIFSLPEHEAISTAFRGSSIYLMGSKKAGKTSTALSFHEFNESKFKAQGKGRTLLLAFEAGYKAIGTPFTPVAVNNFTQFKQIIKQLEQDAKLVADGKKEDTEFELIVFDSLDILATQVIDFVNSKYGVTNLADTPSKCGYREISVLLENELMKLMKLTDAQGQLLYTTVFIGHSEQKEIKCPVTRQKMLVTMPSCEKRVSGIVSKHCDNTMLLVSAEDETTGQENRFIVVRSANVQEIGSRFSLMPNIIPMGNNGARAIHGALMEAIKQQSERDNLKITNVNQSAVGDAPTYNFEELMDTARQLFEVFNNGGKANVFASIVEQCLGVGRRISDCTELQVEALADVINGLKEKATELGLI